MKRIWQIEEQAVEDPASRLRFEFSSVHSDEIAAGHEPPLHDEIVRLRLWTSTRSHMCTLLFARNGAFIRGEVEAVSEGDGIAGDTERGSAQSGGALAQPLSFE